MKNKNTYLIIIIGVILLLIQFFGKRNTDVMLQLLEQVASDTSRNDTMVIETVYRYDTVIHEILTHNINYIPKTDSDALVFDAEPDTNLTVRDYYTQRTFTDTLRDSNIVATYSATIWKNSFFNPQFTYKLIRPQSITTNILDNPRNKIYLGGFLSYSDKPSIGGLLSFQNKKEQMFTAGYGIKMYLVGFQSKISFGK